MTRLWTADELEKAGYTEVAADQREWEREVAKRERKMEQTPLPGIETDLKRETDLQAALVSRCRNHGLTVWSTPNGANLLSGEWRLVKWAKTAESLRQYVGTPGPVETFPQLGSMLWKLHKGMTADKHGQVNKLKNEGMLEGVPDLFLPYPRWDLDALDMALLDFAEVVAANAKTGVAETRRMALGLLNEGVWRARMASGFTAGLLLETKLPGETPTAEQQKMIDWLNANGYRAEIYTELEQGWEIVCDHCGIDP